MIARANSRGFTLLEMMLTVFLIGISVSLVVAKTGQDSDDIARLEARRFAALISHLQDESTITGLPMAIEVSEGNNSYRFWQLLDDWQPVEKQQVLRERTVPGDIRMSFVLLQEEKKESEPDILPSDEGDADETPEAGVKAVRPDRLLVVEPTGLVIPFIAGFAGETLEYRIALDNQQNPVMSENER